MCRLAADREGTPMTSIIDGVLPAARVRRVMDSKLIEQTSTFCIMVELETDQIAAIAITPSLRLQVTMHDRPQNGVTYAVREPPR
jgi:hypothetical protein